MATQFQNRLIGTVILVSLGVIFLPDLLTGKQQKTAEPIASVPLRPEAMPQQPVVAASGAQGQVVVASQAVSSAQPVSAAGQVVATSPAVVSGAAQGDSTEQWSAEDVAPTVTANAAATGAVVAAGAGAVVANAASKPATKSATVAQNNKAAASAKDPAAANLAQPKAVTATKPKAGEIKPLVAGAESKPASKPTDTKPDQKSKPQETVRTPPKEAPKPASLQAGKVMSYAEVVEAQPSSIGVSSSQARSQPSAQVAAQSTAAAKPAAKPSGSAWMIQAGVFSNGENAHALVSKLRSSGLPANVSSFRSGTSTLYRVTVGPDVSRSKMDGLVSKVSGIAGTSAKVIAYNPLG